MAKISNTTSYPNATPAANDYVIGTDTDDNNATKTFKLQEIANLYAGSGSGTVTSVGLSGGTTGITIASDTANPITTTGTFTLGGTLAVANGGTGLTSLAEGSILIGDSSSSISALGIGANTYVLTSNGTTASWAAATGGSGGPGTGTANTIPFWDTTSTLGDSVLSQDAGATKVVLAATKKLEIPNDGTTTTTAINFGTANTGINGYGTTSIGLVSGGQSRIEVTTGIAGGQDITLTGLTQSDGGIRFGVSGETLSSYEEGTWIPQIQLSVGGAATQSSQSGSYTLIGDFVFADFAATITSAGYGVMTMNGLPFSAQSTGGNYGTVQLHNNPDDAAANIQHVNSGSIIGSNVFFKVLDAAALDANGLVLKAASSAGPLASGDVIAGTLIYKKA